MNLYEALGLIKGASAADIKAAFRKLAQQFHPDKEGGDKERFQEVQQAYAVLSDEEKRAHYDETGTIGVQGPTPREEAIVMLSKLANDVIDNFDIDHTNILLRIREMLDGGMKELTGIATKMEKKAEKVRRAIDRMKTVKGKEDSMGQILAGIEKNCTEPLKQIQKQIEILKLAMEILKDHNYDFLVPPQAASGRIFNPFNSSTFGI